MPSVLIRHLYYRVFTAVLLFVLSLLVVLSISGIFTALSQVASHFVPFSTFFYLWLYSVSLLMGYLIPLGVLVGTSQTISQLSYDSELYSLFASGISLHSIYFRLAPLSFLFAGVVLFFTLWLAPFLGRSASEQLDAVIRYASQGNIPTGRFLPITDHVYLYADSFDKKRNEFHDITLISTQKENDSLIVDPAKSTLIVVHARILQTSSEEGGEKIVWELYNGTVHYYKNDKDYTYGRFATSSLRIDNPKIQIKDLTYRSTPTNWLILHTEETGALAELINRILAATSTLMLFLIAFPLGVLRQHSSRFAQAVPTIFVVALYFYGESAVRDGIRIHGSFTHLTLFLLGFFGGGFLWLFFYIEAIGLQDRLVRYTFLLLSGLCAPLKLLFAWLGRHGLNKLLWRKRWLHKKNF